MFSIRKSTKAFTIVEMLVVVSIIGLLLALLLPALGGVKRKSRKSSEMNALKQVGTAWLLYSNSNNDAALPGYMESAVQAPRVLGTSKGWGVKYEFADHVAIPPAPGYGANDLNVAGPWTWRLMSYLDYSHDLIRGYVDEGDTEFAFDGISSDPERALKVAEQPAFGYNGFYIGGYWRMLAITDSGQTIQTPRYMFYDHCGQVGANVVGPLAIPTTIGQIKRSSQLITFCSSTMVSSGSGSTVGPFKDYEFGAHLIMPPSMDTPKWAIPAQGGNQKISILGSGDVYVPITRHTGTAAVLYADGHLDQQSLQGLTDQRLWIDSANNATYTHAPCP